MAPIEKQVEEAVAEIPGISVLLVFGSRARGDARAASDLDVAVLPAGDTADEEYGLHRHRLQKCLAVALADLAPEGRIDVVFLDEAPDTLRQRVMEHGRMVLCRDPAAWQALRVATMKEYGDREWARRLYRRELRRRLLDPSRRKPHREQGRQEATPRDGRLA